MLSAISTETDTSLYNYTFDSATCAKKQSTYQHLSNAIIKLVIF